MIHPDAEPIGHISPYKRIEIGAKPMKPEPKWEPVQPAVSPYDQLFRDIAEVYCG